METKEKWLNKVWVFLDQNNWKLIELAGGI